MSTVDKAMPAAQAGGESTTPVERRGLTRLERGERRFAFLMALPTIIAVLAVMGYPWLYSIWLSLHNMNLLTRRWTWVGLENYTKVIQGQSFQDSMVRTLWFSFMVVAGGTILGLLMALVLNETFRGRGIMRSVMLLPWAIAPVVVGKVFTLIYSGQYGTLNGILYQLGIIESYVPWLTEARRALVLLAAASIWQSAPLSGLLLLGAMQSLPSNLFNAAKIDGASAFQRFRKITVPWIRPTLMFVIMLNTINALMTFDLIYVLTQGGPGESTTVISWLGYITFFNFSRYGEGAAILYILSLISLLFAALYFGILTWNRSKSQVDATEDDAPIGGDRSSLAEITGSHRFESRDPLLSPRWSKKLRRVLIYASVVIIAIWTLFPFYVMINASLSTTEGILARPPDWYPSPLTLENYDAAIFGEQVQDSSGPSVQAKAIILSTKNSMIIALGVTLICLLIGAPAGYAYARYRNFRVLTISLWVLMMTRMIPPLTLAVPFFMLFRRAGLIDTKIGLIIALTSVILPLIVWILRAYFESLPPNLERAALVDGCSRLQAFRRILLPIAVPGLVAAGIFAFLVAWNEFVYAILLTSTLNSQTLPTRIAQFVSDQRIYNPGLLFAAGVMAVIPPILITLALQRFLLRGMLSGAIKG
ncbi:MAG: ABC transporter permease subunit [Thermomicrobiales bacterium]|jgi:multiple sugar transport system permease protein|nr:ABC transporter permease subunit [Thermomicrobiales bacterium]